MIFLSNAAGEITAAIPETINQGSIGVNKIVLIAPFPAYSVVSATFTLPNGIKIYPRYVDGVMEENYPYLMGVVEAFGDKGLVIDGVTVNAWQLTLDKAITQVAGKVTVQFLITTAAGSATADGEVAILPGTAQTLTTTSATLPINRGNAYISPNVAPSQFELIEQYLAAAKLAEKNAETAQGLAESNQYSAQAAAVSAVTNAAAAIAAKNAAIDAKNGAVVAQTYAETAEGNAEIAEGNASNSANSAEQSAITATEQANIAKYNADRYSPWDVVATQDTVVAVLNGMAASGLKSYLFLNIDFTALNLNNFINSDGIPQINIAGSIEKVEFRGCTFEDELGNYLALKFYYTGSQCSIAGAKGDELIIAGFTDVIDCRANIIMGSEYVAACDANVLDTCECVTDTTVWGEAVNCSFVDPYTVNGFVPSTDVGKVPKLTGDGTYAPAPLPQSISLALNPSTYELSLALKDVNGNIIGTEVTVDLPLESLIINASVNNDGDIVLTLQNGQSITIPVSDLISGLASEDWVREQIAGTAGATFIPSVSPEGIISWTNDKGLPNPTPRNIKGDAYVLTSADKQEIGNIVLGDSLTEINTAKNTALTEIAAAQQSNTVQDIGTSETFVLSQKATSIQLSERSNAIIETATGSEIVISDGAPYAQLMHVDVSGVSDISNIEITVSGKNLLPYPYGQSTTSSNGITITDNGDGTLTIDGTSTGQKYFNFSYGFTLKKGTYTFSLQDTNTGLLQGVWNVGGRNISINDYNTVTLEADTECTAYFVVFANKTINNYTIKPQIEFGTAVTPFVPYSAPKNYYTNESGAADVISVATGTVIRTAVENAILSVRYAKDITKAIEEIGFNVAETIGTSDTAVISQKETSVQLSERSNAIMKEATGSIVSISDTPSYEQLLKVRVNGANSENAQITVSGKNLLPYPYTNSTLTANGVTITVGSDGTLTLNGTATGNVWFNFVASKSIYLPKGTYTFSYLNEANSYLQALINAGREIYVNSSNTFTLAEDQTASAAIIVLSGGVFNNLVLNPQLEVGSVVTEFAPYKSPATYYADSNGEAYVKSFVPTTIVSTSLTDATLTVEYAQDIQKAFDEVDAEIEKTNAKIRGSSNIPKIIDNFQTVTGWSPVTTAVGSATVQADSVDFLYGTQSVKFTNAMQKTSFDIHCPEEELRVKLKINSISDGAYLLLYISEDSSFNNYTSWQIYSSISTDEKIKDANNIVRVGEWCEIVLPWAGIGGVDVLERASTFKVLRFAFYGGQGSANIQMISSQPCSEPRGMVTFTFDDGCKAIYTKAAKIFGERGLSATAYIIPEVVGVSENAVTEEQLVSLKYDYGWDIEGHWGYEMEEMNEEQISTAFDSVKTWIKNHGLGDCEHFAYAGGVHVNPIEKTARNYFKTARTIASQTAKGTASTKLPNPYRVPAISSVSDVSPSPNINYVKTLITNIAKYGGWLVLVLHDIGDTPTAMFCSEAGLADLLDHAIDSGVDIKTMYEACK